MALSRRNDVRQMSRFLPCHIAGVLWLAWLALVSFALAGCGATVAPKQTPSLEGGQSATAIEDTVEDARPSEVPVVVEEPPATGEFPSGPPSETDQTSVLIPLQVKNPIVVALLLPLSGRHAALGRALKDAAFLALFELGNPRLVILPRDTGGTAAGAQAAAEQALRDGAQLILPFRVRPGRRYGFRCRPRCLLPPGPVPPRAPPGIGGRGVC